MILEAELYLVVYDINVIGCGIKLYSNSNKNLNELSEKNKIK